VLEIVPCMSFQGDLQCAFLSLFAVAPVQAIVRQLSEEPTAVHLGRDIVSRRSMPAAFKADSEGERPLQRPVSFDVRDATPSPRDEGRSVASGLQPVRTMQC